MDPKYSLDEIDRMRAALAVIHPRPNAHAEVEDRLRTHMLNGTLVGTLEAAACDWTISDLSQKLGNGGLGLEAKDPFQNMYGRR